MECDAGTDQCVSCEAQVPDAIQDACDAIDAECGTVTVTVCGAQYVSGCGVECGGLQYCDGNQCEGCVPGGPDVCGSGEPKPYEWSCPGQFWNGVQDGDETDVDCGGPYHPNKCGVGKGCDANSDCERQACNGGVCANSSTMNVFDCGGPYGGGTFCCAFEETPEEL
jgi:hypothetical protein